jgi:hypothetical protein
MATRPSVKIPTPFPVVLVEAGLLGIIFIAIGSGYLWEFINRLQPDQLFNFFEGLLWTVIGVTFAWHAFRKAEHRRLQIGASFSFLLFGISDFIEMRTGAWYTPWTLFALKAACVLSFLIHLRIYMTTKNKNG